MTVLYSNASSVPLIWPTQFCPGSGWVLEPYNGDEAKTLVTYLAHVSAF